MVEGQIFFISLKCVKFSKIKSMKLIYDYKLEELEELVLSCGYKKYTALQIFKWLYQKRIDQFYQMSDVKKDFIQYLDEHYAIDSITLVEKQVSKDKTTKFLFRLHDGHLVETVLMFFDYGTSACISTQVGCNMGCTFCASGLLKKKRNLSCGEIVNQLIAVQRYLDETNERLDNIVVMGIGEPFDNYENMMKALEIVNHPHSLAIGARHISVSTCGLAPMIRRFAKEKLQYNLAISLHAPNDELRSKLMPINNAFNLKELFSALKEYESLNNRRITFEYLLLNDVNDHEKEADELKELLQGMNAYVNLIPYNSVREKDLITSSNKRALSFYDMLKKRGLQVTLRQKKGDDIDAACGQLRSKHQE